tara:strand:- start:241 stop:420 length:180 start_codon:yes stop_codon:yes gene_type:complete
LSINTSYIDAENAYAVVTLGVRGKFEGVSITGMDPTWPSDLGPALVSLGVAIDWLARIL